MLRSSFYTAGVVLLGATSFAQHTLRPQPITSPVKDAGVYHLGTGTWTRAGHAGNVAMATGNGIIYDNTCNSGYFDGLMVQNGIRVDEGRLPSLGSQLVVGLVGNDSEVGTQNTYTIDGFQIGYCTNENTPRSYVVNFYENYFNSCTSPVTVAATAGFNITGLPASATLGTQACWIVTLDLCAVTASFNMKADADTTFDNSVDTDQFGVSYSETAAITQAADGLILAGGPLNGTAYSFCSGSDGTVFDSSAVSAVYPANQDLTALTCVSLAGPGEPGTGMGTQDSFRLENNAPYANGCYWFGGNPLGSYHLQLYSSNVTLPNVAPGTAFCTPGVDTIACPCGNAPAGLDQGCSNSLGAGASIGGSGVANTPGTGADSLVISATGIGSSGGSCAGSQTNLLCILLQGNLSSAGLGFNDGVRCFTGSLKRIQTLASVSGTFTSTAPIWATSNGLTPPDTIAPGTHRWYGVWYRDACASHGCVNVQSNVSNTYDVLWN